MLLTNPTTHLFFYTYIVILLFPTPLFFLESLELSKEERLEARDDTRLLQENAVWLTGTDGELLRVSSSEQDIIDQNLFTKQACIPWMGK